MVLVVVSLVVVCLVVCFVVDVVVVDAVVDCRVLVGTVDWVVVFIGKDEDAFIMSVVFNIVVDCVFAFVALTDVDWVFVGVKMVVVLGIDVGVAVVVEVGNGLNAELIILGVLAVDTGRLFVFVCTDE